MIILTNKTYLFVHQMILASPNNVQTCRMHVPILVLMPDNNQGIAMPVDFMSSIGLENLSMGTHRREMLSGKHNIHLARRDLVGTDEHSVLIESCRFRRVGRQ